MTLKPDGFTFASVTEELLAYFILFSYRSASSTTSSCTSSSASWPPASSAGPTAPSRLEVGYASLGFAAVGILAFKGGWQVRLAPSSALRSFCGAPRSATSTRCVTAGQFCARQCRRDALHRHLLARHRLCARSGSSGVPGGCAAAWRWLRTRFAARVAAAISSGEASDDGPEMGLGYFRRALSRRPSPSSSAATTGRARWRA